ncbi:MAG: hypothetical protein BGO27_03890 [Alphaproteobacteria bacterium 33-17]|nr:MAG: hypothetical protein BGO27_03890 [Alphaproteobacteria bacterium 33-17]
MLSQNKIANGESNTEKSEYKLSSMLAEEIKVTDAAKEFKVRYNTSITKYDNLGDFPEEFNLDDLITFNDFLRPITVRQLIKAIDDFSVEISKLELENNKNYNQYKAISPFEDWIKNNSKLFDYADFIQSGIIRIFGNDHSIVSKLNDIIKEINAQKNDIAKHQKDSSDCILFKSIPQLSVHQFLKVIKDVLNTNLNIDTAIKEEINFAINIVEFQKRLNTALNQDSLKNRKITKSGSVLKMEDGYRAISMEQILSVALILKNQLSHKKHLKITYGVLLSKFKFVVENELVMLKKFNDIISEILELELADNLKLILKRQQNLIIESTTEYAKISSQDNVLPNSDSLEDQTKELEKLRAENKVLKQKSTILEDQNKALNNIVSSQKVTNESLNQEVNKKADELKSTKSELETIRNLAASYFIEIENLKKEKESTNSTIASLTKEKENSKKLTNVNENEANRIANVIKEKDQIITNLHLKIAEQNKEINKNLKPTEIEELQHKIQSYKKGLALVIGKKECLERKNSVLERENIELNTKLVNSQCEVAKWYRKYMDSVQAFKITQSINTEIDELELEKLLLEETKNDNDLDLLKRFEKKVCFQEMVRSDQKEYGSVRILAKK